MPHRPLQGTRRQRTRPQRSHSPAWTRAYGAVMAAIAANDAAIDAWLAEALNLEQAFDQRAYKLDRIAAFIARLPRPPAPCTVTGTKGKGSTLRFIEVALNAAGLATFAFTSP